MINSVIGEWAPTPYHHSEPFTEDVYWSVIQAALEVSGWPDGLELAMQVVLELGDLWPEHDPIRLLNAPYDRMVLTELARQDRVP